MSLRSTFQAVVEEAVSNGLSAKSLPQNEANIRLRAFSSFPKAVDALKSDPTIMQYYGKDVSENLALRLCHVVLRALNGMTFDQTIFDNVWGTSESEMRTSYWTYVGVAHVQNLESYSSADLGDGISVGFWNPNHIEEIMHWTEAEHQLFHEEWRHIMPSLHVFIVRSSVPKSPANAIQPDGEALLRKTQRALTALRLLRAGDVRIGRLFISRRTTLDLTNEGVHSVGISMLRPGLPYYLPQQDLTRIQETYKLLRTFETESASFQNIRLALHSFNSIYDRQWDQAEDQLVDAITALEALFRIDLEHAFKIAFRAAALLTFHDDARVRSFNEIRTYYKVRSAIVHGSELKPAHKTIIQDTSSLKNVTRRLLLGFLRLTQIRPELRKTKAYDQFYNELDGILQHSVQRNQLRRDMGLTELEGEIQRRAYELFQQRGDSHGSPDADWLKAESEVIAARAIQEKSPTQQWFEAMAHQNEAADSEHD